MSRGLTCATSGPAHNDPATSGQTVFPSCGSKPARLRVCEWRFPGLRSWRRAVRPAHRRRCSASVHPVVLSLVLGRESRGRRCPFPAREFMSLPGCQRPAPREAPALRRACPHGTVPVTAAPTRELGPSPSPTIPLFFVGSMFYTVPWFIFSRFSRNDIFIEHC